MKKIIILLTGVFLIVAVITVIAAVMVFLNQKKQKNFLLKQPITTQSAEKKIDKIKGEDFSFEEFIGALKNAANTYCDQENVKISKDEGEYRGFPWINNDDEIDLVKGYKFYINGMIEDEAAMAVCRENIVKYLKEKLIVNPKNTFQDGVLAFERGGTKCAITSLGKSFHLLRCGDNTNQTTPEDYGGVYRALNPDMDGVNLFFGVTGIIDNFAVAGVITHASLLKKEDGEWKAIFDTQDGFECAIVIEQGVPPSLVGNDCIFYGTTREVWRYNEEAGEWERWYHADSPWERD